MENLIRPPGTKYVVLVHGGLLARGAAEKIRTYVEAEVEHLLDPRSKVVLRRSCARGAPGDGDPREVEVRLLELPPEAGDSSTLRFVPCAEWDSWWG